jgi:cytochrome c553
MALSGNQGGLFGAEIDITDTNGHQFTLHSNGAGNFYSAEPIAFPASVSVTVGGQVFSMQDRPPTGSCNACHAVKTNPDGTLQPAPLPALGLDAGFLTGPTGHIYGFPDSGCVVPVACPSVVPSFQGQVEPIVEANCARCHQPAGTPGVEPQYTRDPPLDDYAHIQAAAGDSLSWLNDCGMPPVDNPMYPWFPMSPEERDVLVNWINCGAPDN